MPPKIDHLILNVNDLPKSIEFYTQILGFKYEGKRDPFSLIRVAPDFLLQLAPWATKGGEHLAFSTSRAEFDEVFARIRQASIPYGDIFDGVGNMRGPGVADGAKGPWKAIYFFDPSKHLIEVAYYEADS
jgi:catechol 2,3-dioxygenase-like lactoylglutathione lyase family enzyme